MSKQQKNLYKNVFTDPVEANAVSIPILCADFDVIEFWLDIDQDSTPDFDVEAYISNQDNMTPPDPSTTSSITNQYDQVMYTDFAGGVNYDSSNPYNPSGGNYPKSFRIYPNGAMWVFLKITNWVDGELTQADINLFNNN